MDSDIASAKKQKLIRTASIGIGACVCLLIGGWAGAVYDPLDRYGHGYDAGMASVRSQIEKGWATKFYQAPQATGTVSGVVKSMEGGVVAVEARNQDPFSGEEMRTYQVTIAPETVISKFAPRDKEQYRQDVITYLNAFDTATTDEARAAVVLPSLRGLVRGSITDIHTGDKVVVKSGLLDASSIDAFSASDILIVQ